MVANAAKAGIRVVFSVYPARSLDAPLSASDAADFGAFLQELARTYPQIDEFIVGNERNQPRFWQPQFDGTAGTRPPRAYAKGFVS
jgi:hypothetical protein